MAAAPPPPLPSTAHREGGNAPVPLFLDTDLGTRLALLVAPDTTIRGLKSRVDAEHATAFPDLGPVAVKSFEVRRKGQLYHLSDSMTVTSAFTKIKGGCFLHVKMTKGEAATRCCQDDGRRLSDGHLGIHVEKRVQELPAMASKIACDVLPQMLEGGDAAAAALNDVQACDALPSSSQLDTEIKKNEAVGLASDTEAERDLVIEKAKSYSGQIKLANQTEGACISSTSMGNVGKPSNQSNISHAVEEIHARSEDILIGDGDYDVGGGVDDKEVRIQEQMLEEMHAMVNPSQEKDHKKSRTDSFDTSAPDPPRITFESDVGDLTKSSRSPLEAGTTSPLTQPLNTSIRQEVQDTLHEDSTENPSIVGKKKKRKRRELAPSKASAQEISEPSDGAKELLKSTGDAYKVELNGRDNIAVKSSGLTLSSSGLNDGNQEASTDLISEQGKFDHTLKECRNPSTGDVIYSVGEVVVSEEENLKGRRTPWNEGENHEQIKQNDAGSHEVVAEISNMDKDGEGTDALQKRQTNDNTSQLKKRKKTKKAGPVGLASLDTIHEKEVHGCTENAVRLDTVSTEREIVHDPLTQQSNNVHQGELNIIENPSGDGKKKKRRRRRSELSKGVDPSQDLTKSSEFVTNESLMHFANAAPLDAKQTTPGSIEGTTVIDHKDLGENLSAKNVIDEVLADLRSKDSSSKDLDEDILTGQTHLGSNKNELELPESTADKVGVSALLPPKYPADAPASSPRLKKSKGEKLEVLSTTIDSCHHSRSAPKEDANGELNESDSLKFSEKASDPKAILNGDAVAQADDKPKATKRRRKKVSSKQVPADDVKTLDEQVTHVDTLGLKGVNATQANDVMAIESASPNAQETRKKHMYSELQSWDPALEHDSSADLGNLRPEKSLIRSKNSADAAEQNYDSAVHPASAAIHFLDHFGSSEMNDPSVSAEHKQDNEDETLREVKNKKKNKRKHGTGSIEPDNVLESPPSTDKTCLTGHLGTGRAIVPFVAAENMNNEDEDMKNGKVKKRKRKANKEMFVTEKENPNSDNQGIDIGTQETLSAIQKGSMGQDNGKDRSSKFTHNKSIVQHKPEDATLENKLHQTSVDDQNMLPADKDHVPISKDVRKSTSKLKPLSKSKHDDSIKGRVAPNPNPARNLVKDFSTSPLVSSESTESTPQNANRYRVAVRKVSSKRYEQQAIEKSKKENRKVAPRAIFNDANSEDSDDELDTKNEKAFMEASVDNSSTSGDSGISSAADDESDVPDDDGTVSLSQKSLRDGLHIGSILRGSSSYKKARKKQSELVDDDIIVPDSQPADGLWD